MEDHPVRMPTPTSWDEVWDVVVVGCGYAGAMAAIAAHDRGARVLILEKAEEAGGISVCSAGGVGSPRTPLKPSPIWSRPMAARRQNRYCGAWPRA